MVYKTKSLILTSHSLKENVIDDYCTYLLSFSQHILYLCTWLAVSDSLWPLDYNRLSDSAPLSKGFPRQGYWSGFPFPPPGDFPDPGVELTSSAVSSALQVDSLLTEPSEKPPNIYCKWGHKLNNGREWLLCFLYWQNLIYITHSVSIFERMNEMDQRKVLRVT